MIRLQLSLQLDYEVFAPGCDFVFNIHAATTARQRVLDEALTLSQYLPSRIETEPATGNRYLRLTAAPGPLQVLYNATVEIDHHIQKKIAIEMRPMVQNSECANTARMPTGETSAPIAIKVLRVRLGLQPARCKRIVKYPPLKFERSATRNGIHATAPIAARLRPRSRLRNSGIQKT